MRPRHALMLARLGGISAFVALCLGHWVTAAVLLATAPLLAFGAVLPSHMAGNRRPGDAGRVRLLALLFSRAGGGA